MLQWYRVDFEPWRTTRTSPSEAPGVVSCSSHTRTPWTSGALRDCDAISAANASCSGRSAALAASRVKMVTAPSLAPQAISPFDSVQTHHTDKAGTGTSCARASRSHTRTHRSSPLLTSPSASGARAYTKAGSDANVLYGAPPWIGYRRSWPSLPALTKAVSDTRKISRTACVAPSNTYSGSFGDEIDHRHTVLSAEADRIRSSSIGSTDHTEWECPASVATHSQFFHTRTVESQLPLTM